jgi:hypothetical protein
MSYWESLKSKIGKESEMKKSNLISAVFIITLWLSVTAPAYAAPEILVTPMEYDFGMVEVNTSATTIILVSNIGGHDLEVTGISLSGSIDFTIISMPTLPAIIPPPNGHVRSIEVEVSYTPAALGYTSALLEITSNVPAVQVTLGGEGIDDGQTPMTIEDILAFFDAGVEAGTIQGTGPNENARNSHLKVFEWRLLLVAFFLDKGSDRVACILLWNAYGRSDGQDRPKDFIKGQNVGVLNAIILQFIADLGCQQVGGSF